MMFESFVLFGRQLRDGPESAVPSCAENERYRSHACRVQWDQLLLRYGLAAKLQHQIGKSHLRDLPEAPRASLRQGLEMVALRHLD